MESLQELKQICENCHKCSLCEKRQNMVFGVGNENAEIMLIGEGPGAEEDKKGEPFVGASGRLLDILLSYFDLSREKNVYIANIVKCRPENNRDPLEEEQNACFPYLLKQIDLISPKIIICLGRISAQRMIDPEFRITKDHGVFFEKDGRFFLATYHPSALLRDPLKKQDAFLDFKAISQKISELSITI